MTMRQVAAGANNPKRGEVWLINLDPTLGAEIRKTRPAIVVSSDLAGKLPLKLVVPVTDWKETFASNLWHVQIKPEANNGLIKPSSADTLQLRSVDLQRFVRKLGLLSPPDLESIIVAIVTVIEYKDVTE